MIATISPSPEQYHHTGDKLLLSSFLDDGISQMEVVAAYEIQQSEIVSGYAGIKKALKMMVRDPTMTFSDM